jgi:hypothetical protein
VLRGPTTVVIRLIVRKSWDRPRLCQTAHALGGPLLQRSGSWSMNVGPVA